jgi:hypothetical protein
MDHPFNEFLTDVCDDQDGYAVSPVAGSAIMFDSVRPGTFGSLHSGVLVNDVSSFLMEINEMEGDAMRVPSFGMRLDTDGVSRQARVPCLFPSH